MTRQPEPIVCGHPDRPHYALGLCHACYQARYRRLQAERWARIERRLAEMTRPGAA